MKIFDLEFFQGSYQDALMMSTRKRPGYYCFANAHMLHEHRKNSRFKGVLEAANAVFPDGMPIVYSMRWFLSNQQERIAGNDFIFDLVKTASEKNMRIFWIGGSQATLDIISIKLGKQGIAHEMYSPPFLPIEQFDFESQSERIKDFDPDLIMVGLGCPKQEIWMNEMKNRVQVPMFGIGGAFQLFAGIDSRAPRWMRKLSLEWIYRLALEPKRLFRRYLVTNVYFCSLFGKELIRKKVLRK